MLRDRSDLTILETGRKMAFDGGGNLLPLLRESQLA
jgi:hypothetical protein